MNKCSTTIRTTKCTAHMSLPCMFVKKSLVFKITAGVENDKKFDCFVGSDFMLVLYSTTLTSKYYLTQNKVELTFVDFVDEKLLHKISKLIVGTILINNNYKSTLINETKKCKEPKKEKLFSRQVG